MKISKVKISNSIVQNSCITKIGIKKGSTSIASPTSNYFWTLQIHTHSNAYLRDLQYSQHEHTMWQQKLKSEKPAMEN